MLPLASYIGMDISHRNNIVTISQDGYLKEILQDHCLDQSNTVPTPITITLEADAEGEDNTTYRSIIGAINYLAGGTCPEISYAFNQLSQHL